MVKYIVFITIALLYISLLSITEHNSIASEALASKPESSEADAELKELRNKIDVINEQILLLLNERAKVVLEIGELKDRNSMEIYDPDREKEIENKLEQLNNGPLTNEAVIKIFREIISASRDLQKTK